jgi:hypothetical protein
MIPADNYIVAQTANKVLLSRPDRFTEDSSLLDPLP